MANNLTDFVFNETLKYLKETSKEKRKLLGQFFTSAETARYMASMFDSPRKEEIRILDPGAGSGILSAAVIDALQEYHEEVNCIYLHCYENDPNILTLLKRNIDFIAKNSKIKIVYKIFKENYILSKADEFNNATYKESDKYDLIIGNPPYKKINKNSEEAKRLSSMCHGAPNLYFLFAALSLFDLSKTGEMVYIMPRSWTSGAYFRKFREYLFTEGTLKRVHLFADRSKVFDKEDVLQETVIIKINKSNIRNFVRITSSTSSKDFADKTSIVVPYSLVVTKQDKYLCLPINEEDVATMKTVGEFTDTLASIGFKMKTGLVVEFRNKDRLRNEEAENCVPLLCPKHVCKGEFVFPTNKGYEYVSVEKLSILQANKNYLLVKRFATKEEARRLQSAVYLFDFLKGYGAISTHDKLNFIEAIDFDMTVQQVYGLFVIFNSDIYDQYYRILNGSTQVNSTEINSMPTPSLREVEWLGEKLIFKNDVSVSACNELIAELLSRNI